MAAVVAGDADLPRRAEQRARLARIAVALAKVDAVRPPRLASAMLSLTTKATVALGTDRLEGLGQARRLMLVHILHTAAERRDFAPVQRRAELIGKVAADLWRGDQIELPGRAAPAAKNGWAKSGVEGKGVRLHAAPYR
jgi:hypothetical protein